MRGDLSGLTFLVLPDGAITGARLVFNGDTGSIEIYTTTGDLMGLLTISGPDGDPGFFVFEPGNPDEYVALEAFAGFPGVTFASSDADAANNGRIRLLGPGAAVDRQMRLAFSSPDFVGTDQSEFEMRSEAADGSIAPYMDVTSGDLRVGGQSVARGLALGGTPFRETVNDPGGATAAGNPTDMTTTVELIAGRWYEVQAHSQYNIGTAGVTYALVCDYDGTIIGRFDRKNANETAGALTQFCDGSVIFQASADDAAATFTLENDAGSGGTVLMTAAAAFPRTLTVKDIG